MFLVQLGLDVDGTTPPWVDYEGELKRELKLVLAPRLVLVLVTRGRAQMQMPLRLVRLQILDAAWPQSLPAWLLGGVSGSWRVSNRVSSRRPKPSR